MMIVNSSHTIVETIIKNKKHESVHVPGSIAIHTLIIKTTPCFRYLKKLPTNEYSASIFLTGAQITFYTYRLLVYNII